MEIYLFISLVCLCLLSMVIFLICRVKYGGLTGVFTKIFASFCFIVLAVFLNFVKIQPSFYTKISICLIILGLVCGLIGDVLLDLKIIYPFHNDKYLKAGMVSFGVGHIFYISSMLILLSEQVNIFSKFLPLVLILLGSLILSALVWVISKYILKLNFGKNTLITNCYSFILLLTTAISVYLCFMGLNIKFYILVAGFVLFLISDLILSIQYFGGKQDSKPLIVLNHLFYYLAQIIIASFIYFI